MRGRSGDEVPAAAVLTARSLADSLLWPAPSDVRAHLDALASAGLYGVAGPVEYGGLGLSRAELASVGEALAYGSVTTTLVWGQHHGAVGQLARTSNSPLREQWLAGLCSGEVRAGVLFAGLLPGPPRVRATPGPDGWTLDGEAPWVSGWGLVDVLSIAARTPDDEVLWFVVPSSAAGLTAAPTELTALELSRTVRVTLASVPAPKSALAMRFPYEQWPAIDAANLRLNGSMPLGLAARCCALLGPSPLDEELDSVRSFLDSATVEELPAGRAAAAELAYRAAGALVVHAGSGAVLTGRPAERLVREAAVLLVFATRPTIKAELADRLQAPRRPDPSR